MKCYKCLKDKEPDSFRVKSNGTYMSMCDICVSLRKKYYDRNKSKIGINRANVNPNEYIKSVLLQDTHMTH